MLLGHAVGERYSGAVTKLHEVVAVLDRLYDPSWAESWDAVGTVAGDPDADVQSVLFAVDPVQAVADEAVRLGVDLVVTHHPLYLKPTNSVAANTAKGRVVHTLIGNGVGLHTCHTNADVPPLGVSEAMADALGLVDVLPLEDDPDPGPDKWVVFVPAESADAVAAAMHDAGAGRMGDYDRAQFQSSGIGSFRPLDGAQPAIGEVGAVETVDEIRIELVATRAEREQVRGALLQAHPYEEVAYDIIETAGRSSGRGTGRVGRLPESMRLGDFAESVRVALPAHSGATRIAGDLQAEVRTVALCGGAGDFLLGRADASGADVYVTSDLRHHPVSEHREETGACAVIDVPHWAAEWTWLPVAAHALEEHLSGTVKTHVSTIVTDPWTATLS